MLMIADRHLIVRCEIVIL